MNATEVLAVEDELWFGGAEAYRRHLADDALVVVPGASLDRDQTIAAIDQAPRWSGLERHDERLLALGPSRLLVHYRAEASRADGQSYRALVSSVYQDASGRPQLVFHQQTPMPQ